MRCCSSVESRYSHSSSPNRRPETRPSQILNVESFIFQTGASARHTHILSLLFGGAPEITVSLKETLRNHKTFTTHDPISVYLDC